MLPCPWGREISPLRSAAVKMTGRSHLYFRHRYSLLQASYLFLHSSPPGGDFLMEWGMAAGGNGRISEHALDGASCILSVNIEFFKLIYFHLSDTKQTFFVVSKWGYVVECG